MSFPLYIAKRYLFSKSSTNAINIITIIATVGVSVGALALFLVLSIFSGLKEFNTTLLSISDPDLKITPAKGKSFLLTTQLKETLDKQPNIVSYAQELEERVFLKYNDKNHIANIKGVDAQYQKTIPIDSSIFVGTWIDRAYKNTVVVGYGISDKLSLSVYNLGEPLEIYVPKPGKGYLNPNNAFRSVGTQVIGVYGGGSKDFRDKYVFTELEVAQGLLNYKPNQISAIAIRLDNPDEALLFKNKLAKILGTDFKVRTREELNSLFYKVMKSESFFSYLIVTFIAIIALFNIIGAIIMMILDKRANLKTLFNLGTHVADIKKIFVLQGFLLTAIGMFIGLFLAILLVLFQQYTGYFMITPTVPYPVKFNFFNLIIVVVTIVVLGFLAAKIASSRISKEFVVK